MKHLPLTLAVTFLFASSLAAAQQVIVTPNLPADITSWSTHTSTCTPKKGIQLIGTRYDKKTASAGIVIYTTDKNNERVFLHEIHYVVGQGVLTDSISVKNAGRWTTYAIDKDVPENFAKANEAMLTALGVTEEEYDHCH